MFGLDWTGYQSLLALRGDRSRPRLAYLDGAVELVSPSHGHQTGMQIGQVLVFYCLEVGIDISGHGSWTLNKQLDEAGAEPDECFIFGDHDRTEHGVSARRADLRAEPNESVGPRSRSRVAARAHEASHAQRDPRRGARQARTLISARGRTAGHPCARNEVSFIPGFARGMPRQPP